MEKEQEERKGDEEGKGGVTRVGAPEQEQTQPVLMRMSEDVTNQEKPSFHQRLGKSSVREAFQQWSPLDFCQRNKWRHR